MGTGWNFRIVATMALVLTLGKMSTPSASATAAANASAGPEALFGKTFIATSVKGAPGKKPPFERPLDIELFFFPPIEPEGLESRIGLDACNGMSLSLEIVGGTLRVGGMLSTTKKYCGGKRDGDAWLLRFFRSDPHWWLNKGRLKLWSHGAAMHFRSTLRSE